MAKRGRIWATGKRLTGRGRSASAIRLCAAVLAAVFLIAPVAVATDGGQSLEYQVKAAFLLNFTKFIEWPPGPDATFTICILGDDPFGAALDRIMEGETVNGRKVAVQRIRRPQENSCQIIFAKGPEREVVSALAGIGPGILTVGESGAFLRDGGMVAFVIENRRVRFDINLQAATRAGLKLSSKLLNVARFVEK